MSDYKLDFDKLRKIYRLEIKSPKLSKLNPDFYKGLRKYIKEEKKKYLEALESFSQMDLKRFETLKKIVQKIKEIRLKKCLNMCLIYSRTNDFKDDNLVGFEIDFVKSVIKLVDKQSEYIDSLFTSNKSKSKKSKDYIKVKVIKDIPSFIGTDMKEYGPYEKNQICKVPKNVYKILKTKDIVEKVN